MKKHYQSLARAYNKLQHAYASGTIIYPRTNYDYMTDPYTDLYPHPPLAKFDKYARPLSFESYPFIMATLPVELLNHNIVTAATTMRIMARMDRWYDDNLIPNPRHEKDIETMVRHYSRHCDHLVGKYGEIILGDDGKADIDKFASDGAISRVPMDLELYRVPIEPLPESLRRQRKNRRRRDSAKNYTTPSTPISSVEKNEAVLEIQRKKQCVMDYIGRRKDLFAIKKINQGKRRRQNEKTIREKRGHNAGPRF